MKIKSWKYFFIFWFSSFLLSASSEKPLTDYRDGIHVFKAHKCPENESEWRASSKRLNCSIDNDPPVNQYYCLPSAKRDMLVEFCYDKGSHRTEPGFCWELAGKGYLNYVNCTEFKAGCPNNTYFSEKIYMHQACLRIDPDKKCFLAEEGCMLTSNTTTTESTPESNDYLAAIISGLIFALLLLGILLLYFFYKRKHQQSTSQLNSSHVSTLSSLPSNSLQNDTTYEEQPFVEKYGELTPNSSSETTMENSETDDFDKFLQSDKYNGAATNLLSDVSHEEILKARINSKNKDVLFDKKASFYGSTESSFEIVRCAWQIFTKKLDDGTEIFSDIAINCERYEGSSNSPANPVLVINKTKFSDEGRYRLIVQNERGKTSQSNEIFLGVHGSKPKITLISGVNYKVDYGKSISIRTKIEARPPVREYEWQKLVQDKDFETLNISSEKFRYSGTNQSVLRINDVSFKDEGKYRAKVSNAVGEEYSQTFTITVEGDVPKPVIKKKKKRVQKDSEVTLQAVINSNPRVINIRWQVMKTGTNIFCDIDLTKDKYKKSYSDRKNVVLIIENVQESDKGKYRLVVENDLGEGKSSDVTLEVVNETRNEKEPFLSLTPFWNKRTTVQEAKLEHAVHSETPVLLNAIPERNVLIDSMNSVFDISWRNGYGHFISDDDGNIMMIDAKGTHHKPFKPPNVGKVLRHSLAEDGSLLFTGICSIMKISTNKEISSFIVTDWEPQCIHVSNLNGDILVGLLKQEESKVIRYDKKGKIQQCIQKIEGNPLYLHPYYLTENINGDILVSDQTMRSVVGVNKEGLLPFIYGGQERNANFCPYGISTDNNGYIFILNFSDSDIFILNKHGRFIQKLCFTLQTSPLYQARALSTNGVNKLFVGHSVRGCQAEVRIYKYRQNDEHY